MKERCDNPKHHASKRYSDRGISYCDKWSSFEGFLSDMGDRPKGRSLDRKDNNKGYSLENCRWATPREQALNRATNVVIKYKGQSRILRDWAREFSMNPNTFYTRYKNGWTMSEIENTPILKRADNDSCKKNNSKSKRR